MTDGPRISRRRRRGKRHTAAPLAPPRDAGITLRDARRSRSALGGRAAGAVAVALLFVLAGFGLARVAPGPAIPQARIAAASGLPTALASVFAKPTPPTPYFATFRGIRLRLPVPAASVTVLAFHQASYPEALGVGSLVRIGSLADAARAAARKRARPAQAAASAPATASAASTPSSSASTSTTRAVAAAMTAAEPERSDAVWTGSALQLWRSGRTGKMNTAIDCGARPGTPVFSPLDGTVMLIRSYKLYGKYPDFEIHIKPDLWSDVDVIVLHTTDPCVAMGQHVVAGVDQISKVRSLASTVPGLQLREYTAEGGNHTHVQVNRILKPGRVWIVGQDPPGAIRRQ
jgi:hypothetical protein